MKRLSLLFLGLFVIAGCGYDKDKEVEIVKVPYKGEDNKNDVNPGLAVVKANCVSCHAVQAPVMKSDAAIQGLAGKICSVIKAGSMPPSGPLPDDQKALILKGFECS